MSTLRPNDRDPLGLPDPRAGQEEVATAMDGITIEIQMDAGERGLYRFDEPVVRLGRGEECHLRLCHEAVPRRVCSVWVEDGGEAVCLEPYPGLSNPLRYRGGLVEGSLRGPRLEVSIGPMALSICPTRGDEERGPRTRRGQGLWIAAGLAAVGLAGVVVALGLRGASRPSSAGPDLGGALAASPLCPAPETSCGEAASCAERARLAATRAEELLGRPGISAKQRVEAVQLLEQAVAWLARIGDPSWPAWREQLEGAQRSVRHWHRGHVAAVRVALASGQPEQAVPPLVELAELLEPCAPQAASILEEQARLLEGGTR